MSPTGKQASRRAQPSRSRATPGEDMIQEVDEASVPRTALATYSDQPAMDGSDLFIPRLRLAQGLTQEVQNGEAKPGQWLVLGANPMEEVRVIPVAMTKRRELRDPDTRAVLCRSGDAINGVGNPGGECATCEMAQWTKATGKGKAGGKNNAPLCAFLYSYMVYIVQAKSLAILEFSRTSITTGKMINTMVAQRGIGTFSIALGAVSKQGPKGTFYSPTVKMEAAKPEELKRALAEMKKV